MPANFQIDTFTWFCIIDTDFDACRDYRSPPAGSPGAPREPLGAHLTTFDKYIKNAKIWIMQFWGLLEQMSNITQVLLMFLRCHFEAQFEQCCKIALFIIHLRQELLCIFIDFDVFSNQKQSSDFRSESLCVTLNAFSRYWFWASPCKKWFFGLTSCSFLTHLHVDVKSSYVVLWRPHGQK